MSRILVCDDDKEIVEAITIYLQREGYETIHAYDGMEAIAILEREKVDLLIVDMMMPGLSGVETIFRIREKDNLPIIILSAKSEDQDKIFGLKVGADDYLTKPFNPMELIARVQSQLRRSTVLNQNYRQDFLEEQNSRIYQKDMLVVDDDKKAVTVEGKTVRLTPIEYQILLFLMKNQGQTFSSAQIYEQIWDEEALGSDNVVAVHIRHIREKIEIDPKNPRYIQVVWGIGYCIEKE